MRLKKKNDTFLVAFFPSNRLIFYAFMAEFALYLALDFK